MRTVFSYVDIFISLMILIAHWKTPLFRTNLFQKGGIYDCYLVWFPGFSPQSAQEITFQDREYYIYI